MNVNDLARHEDLQLLVCSLPGRGDVARVCASNTMSDLIANAGRDTLIVTALNTSQIVRVAELMDVPGICLAAGIPPSDELMECARAAGTALLVTPLSLAEARALLERLLAAKAAQP